MGERVDPLVVKRFGEFLSQLRNGKSFVRDGSPLERPELQPGFDQLQHHFDRALVWAEEINDILTGALPWD